MVNTRHGLASEIGDVHSGATVVVRVVVVVSRVVVASVAVAGFGVPSLAAPVVGPVDTVLVAVGWGGL